MTRTETMLYNRLSDIDEVIAGIIAGLEEGKIGQAEIDELIAQNRDNRAALTMADKCNY